MPKGMCLPRFARKAASPIFEKIYGKSKAEITSEPGIWGANTVTLCDDMQTVKTAAVRIIPEKPREHRSKVMHFLRVHLFVK